MNKVFKTIFDQRINEFEFDFKESCNTLYWSEEEKKLVHPGEYGIYRENSCKNLLRFILPDSISIDSGFIISSSGAISTQCDIVLFDRTNTPILRSKEHQNFFPAETLIGIGEVKSVLSKTKLKDSLIKLSKNKAIRESLDNESVRSIDGNRVVGFNAKTIITHMPISFLICEKFSFNIDNLVDEFEELYKGIELRNRHNLILSIDDGVFLYADNIAEGEVGRSAFPYPINGGTKMKNYHFSNKSRNGYMFFAQHLYVGTKQVVHPEFNIFKYLKDDGDELEYILERN
jgi:hypothetical protein